MSRLQIFVAVLAIAVVFLALTYGVAEGLRWIIDMVDPVNTGD